MKRTLVIGASENPDRYSYKAIKMLRAYGHEVLAIGGRQGKVEDVSFNNEKKVFDEIDTVTLYVGPKNQIEFYQYILNLNPRRVIFNPGTENPEFQDMLMAAGIYPEIACTLVLLSTGQYE